MNEKMRSLKSQIDEKLAAIKGLDSEKDGDAMAAALDECDNLQKAFDLEQRRYEAEKAHVGGSGAGDERKGAGKEQPTGFALLAKCIRGEELEDVELKSITPPPDVAKALVTGTGATQGENYLIPEDVNVEIRELRRSYVSAKDLVTVIPTDVLAGSFNFESGAPTGLIAFDDGDDVPNGGEPSFTPTKFAIAFKGSIIPVSNILAIAEKAGLLAYLNRWFIKNAIISENKDIFAELAEGKAAKALTGLADLKSSINVDLDPSCLIGGVIVTNQTGFDLMDTETDENGRGLLQPDPADDTKKKFKGLPIKVFPDAILANVEGKAPVFYGATHAGAYFVEFKYTFFASSAHAGFTKNRTLMRVIEGYDVISADKEAYCYGLLSGPAAG